MTDSTVNDFFLNDALALVKEKGVCSHSLLQRRFGLGFARTCSLMKAVLSKLCSEVPEEILMEFFALSDEISYKDALMKMEENAILACDACNGYADAVSRLEVYSLLLSDGEIEKRILDLLEKKDPDVPRHIYSSTDHNRRIRFALHLFGAYRISKDRHSPVYFRRFEKKLLRKLIDSIRIATVTETVMEFLAFFLLRERLWIKSLTSDDRRLLISACESLLRSSRFRCAAASCLLAVLASGTGNPDQQPERSSYLKKTFRKYAESNSIAGDLVWFMNTLHGDPEYDWQSDSENRKEILKEKCLSASAAEGLSAQRIQCCLDGFPADQEISDDLMKTSLENDSETDPENGLIFSLPYFRSGDDLMYLQKCIEETVENTVRNKRSCPASRSNGKCDVISTLKEASEGTQEKDPSPEYRISVEFWNLIERETRQKTGKYRIVLKVLEQPYSDEVFKRRPEYKAPYKVSVGDRSSGPVYAHVIYDNETILVCVTADIISGQKIKPPYEIQRLLTPCFGMVAPEEDPMMSRYVCIDFSGLDTEGVKNMSFLFAGCFYLQDLILDGFNTSSVTNMDSMFLGSYSLKYLDLSSFDFSCVTTVRRMFKGCCSLRQILGDPDTGSIPDREGMLDYCLSLDKETSERLGGNTRLRNGQDEKDAEGEVAEYYRTLTDEDFTQIEADPLFYNAMALASRCRNFSAALFCSRFGIDKVRAMRLAAGIINWYDASLKGLD